MGKKIIILGRIFLKHENLKQFVERTSGEKMGKRGGKEENCPS